MNDAAMGATRIWYVQFEDERGKMVVEKHSTGRLLKMLASAKITAKARAKVSADGTYYPLAQFPEFAKAVEDSLAASFIEPYVDEPGNCVAAIPLRNPGAPPDIDELAAPPRPEPLGSAPLMKLKVSP